MQKITPEELAQVILDCKEGMYRLAFSIVGNDADAQDAVGDTIVKAYENMRKLRKRESAKPWLMQILVNSSKDIVKKKSKWKFLENEEEELQAHNPFESDKLWLVVMELPADFRIVVALYYYEQFSVREISVLLGISEGTVKSRLARGREKLSRLLE